MDVKLAIDLLWVRPKKVGGIESYIRNILDGFSSIEDSFEFWLMVSKDNKDTFVHYEKDERFHIYVCNIDSENVSKAYFNSLIIRKVNTSNTCHLSKHLHYFFKPYWLRAINPDAVCV